MSHVIRKPVFGVSNRSDIKRAVQPQKIARGLKIQIKVVEGLNYLYSKTKMLISCAISVQLIGVFVFAYAKSRFSHDTAH